MFRYHCDRCGDQVGDKTYEWSMYHYGKVLCYDCQPRTIDEAVSKWKEKETTENKLGIGDKRVNDY